MFAVKGEVPERELVYRLLKGKAVKEVVTYAELDAVLGRDFRQNRSPFYAAVQLLEDNDSRSLDNVPRTGYRVVEAAEHERLARKHHGKARRQATKAVSKIRSADRSQLSVTDRARFDAMQVQLTRNEQMLRRLDAKVERVAADLTETREELPEMVEGLLRKHGLIS